MSDEGKKYELSEEELVRITGGDGKTYQEPEGTLCPVCQIGIIKMTLGDFLYGNGFTCPTCKTHFTFDKSQNSGTLEKLKKLYEQRRS